MLKQSTDEELIIKQLFEECLRIQKERMLEIKKYVREKNELMVKRQLDQIQSIENGYKNKLDYYNEKIKSKKIESEIRERAQKSANFKEKKELKENLEDQIRNVQDQMNRDKDFLHWRQIDANTTKLKVLKANYQSLKS